jgi:L-ascorbate metabolism protein UlaG (beta-lactamase superfamily)
LVRGKADERSSEDCSTSSQSGGATIPGASREALAASQGDPKVRVYWLGQAGFVFQAGGRRLLIDPYLSDTLADKYRGSATPHERMASPPIDLPGLGKVDLVLATHHHTDHMDPGTLSPLAQAQPSIRFVVPRASRTEALKRIDASENRLVLLDAGETFEPWPGLSVAALRAAHETLELDEKGDHRFLGYGLVFRRAGRADVTVIHSGDTIPFKGQLEEIRQLRPDLLLLPVNGRSAALTARGIPGNLTLDEAVALTIDSGAPTMIAHHHGLFAFNTLPLEIIERKARESGLPVRLIAAREGLEVGIG